MPQPPETVDPQAHIGQEPKFATEPADLAVLEAIAFHRWIGRDGLKAIFGREISRDLIGRLVDRDPIGTGPREPRRGAPYTFATTETFLATFGMESLRGLPVPEQMQGGTGCTVKAAQGGSRWAMTQSLATR